MIRKSLMTDRNPIRSQINKNKLIVKNLESETINSTIKPAKLNFADLKMANISEINLAKDMIPNYQGGTKNLSYFLRQCEKLIDTYRVTTTGLENCTLNKLLFEICCSKLIGDARDTLVILNCSTWSVLKQALITRFGDSRNENLLENDLTTCFQLIGEHYEQYYERIKNKLQQLLEHLSIIEVDINLRNYKMNLYTNKALETFKAGLIESYRNFLSFKVANTLEDCLVQLRNYDNHKQQVNFLSFMRQKTPIKNVNKNFDISNQQRSSYQQNQVSRPQFNSNQNFRPQFNSNQNFRPQFNSNQNFRPQFNPNQNFKPQFNSNQFPNGPINYQTRPVFTKFPTNSQVFGKKPEFKPTPMSISTKNTGMPNQIPNRNYNHFQNTGPRNFISEELFNVNLEDQLDILEDNPILGNTYMGNDTVIDEETFNEIVDFYDPNLRENEETPRNPQQTYENPENFQLTALEQSTST